MTADYFPPSSAGRRVACPGSRALEAQYKTHQKSQAAEEGIAAHWAAQELLKQYAQNRFSDEIAEDKMPRHIKITPEMMEAARIYRDAIIKVDDGKSNMYIEEKLHISRIHENCYGIPDCYFKVDKNLYIFDFKYGHTPIEAYENWTLIEYAVGIMENFIFNSPDFIIFKIVQPRDFTGKIIKEWKIKLKELADYAHILVQKEFLSAQPNAARIPNPQCVYCTARHACPELQKAALIAVDISEQNVPTELTPEGVGSELRLLKQAEKMLQARIMGLTQQAISLLESGKKVLHFNLNKKIGRENWNVTADEIISLGEMFGVDLKKPIETLTPRQARLAGIDEKIIKEYAERLPGAIELVPEDINKIKKLFEI
jgi:hypothetical protein